MTKIVLTVLLFVVIFLARWINSAGSITTNLNMVFDGIIAYTV